jgi:hypothetical protein
MTQKIYDVAVKVRSYTDKDGKTKGVWENVGAVWKGDDGGVWLSLARWFNPAGIANPEHRPEVNLSLFKPNSGAASE